MQETIIIVYCYRRSFIDQYRYEEKCLYRHQYDTDLIIGGTLIVTQVNKFLAKNDTK